MDNKSLDKLNMLVSIYVFCLVAAEALGGKTFPVASFGSIKINASIGIFFIPLIFTVNDVITEVFGPKMTRKVIRMGLVTVALFYISATVAVNLQPTERFRAMEPAFKAIFGQSARISLASLIAFALSDFLDLMVFSKIRERFGRRALWFRNNVSNMAAQLADTAIFITLSFYALNLSFEKNMAFLASLIVPYWGLKCFMSLLETPLVYLGIRWFEK